MIYFCGDLNLTDNMFDVGFGIGTKIKNGFDPLRYIEREKDDIWIGNFEGVASNSSCNKGIYSKAFRIEPEVLKNISNLNIYGVANNHVMEHGPEAYLETVNSLESFGCKVFGLKNKKSHVFKHNEILITITGICTRIEKTKWDPLYWYNPEYKDIEKEIKLLPSEAFKVLFIHWGNEFINRPSDSQRKFAHWLIDSGFDLIIGMHPHVLQGYENYNGKRIYYSLGNCVFNMQSEQCNIGAIVELNFEDGNPIYNEKYIKIDHDCCPRIVEEKNIPKNWCFSFLNKELIKEDNSEEYHEVIKAGYLKYRKENRKKILMSAFAHPITFIQVMQDFIKRKLY